MPKCKERTHDCIIDSIEPDVVTNVKENDLYANRQVDRIVKSNNSFSIEKLLTKYKLSAVR